MAQAFANDATQQTTTPTATEDAAAITQPVATEPASVTPAKTGEPPQEKWPTILANARTKAADEALAKHRETYGWAEQIPQAQLQEIARQTQRISSDPVGHIRDLVAEVGNHPTFGPQLRSEFARILGSARGQAKVDLTPDFQVVGNDGQVAGQAFSAEKTVALIQQAVAEAVSPLKQESVERKTAADQQAAMQKAAADLAKVSAKVDDVMTEMHDILDITDPKAEASVALYAAVNDVMAKNPTWSAHKAALEVRKTQIKPGLDAKAQQSALDSLKTKAAAQSVNPAGAAVSTTHRPMRLTDPSLKWS